MNIQSFVSESIVQICNGVSDAATRLADTDSIVCPGGVSFDGDNMYVNEKYRRPVQNVEFDIAVTTTEGKGTEGGIAIRVGSIGLGTTGRSDSESSSTSRLRFNVPVSLPTTRSIQK